MSATDSLTLAAGGNTFTLANVETVIGKAGTDQITATTGFVSGWIDLGSGTDNLVLANAAGNTLTVVNAETVAGGVGDDEIQLGGAIPGGLIDLGSGDDSLTLADAAHNTVTIRNVEVLTAGTGSDVVDRIRQSIRCHRSRQWSRQTDPRRRRQYGHAKQYRGLPLGGTGSDQVTLVTAFTAGKIDLGAGGDSPDPLPIPAGIPSPWPMAKPCSVRPETMSLFSPRATTAGSIDLSIGDDKLTLGGSANTVLITNVETIVGSCR